MTDKPHILTVAVEPDNRIFVDFVYRGTRTMGYYRFSEIFTQIQHQQVIDAVLDVAGIDSQLSLKEKISMFNLLGGEP